MHKIGFDVEGWVSGLELTWVYDVRDGFEKVNVENIDAETLLKNLRSGVWLFPVELIRDAPINMVECSSFRIEGLSDDYSEDI